MYHLLIIPLEEFNKHTEAQISKLAFAYHLQNETQKAELIQKINWIKESRLGVHHTTKDDKTFVLWSHRDEAAKKMMLEILLELDINHALA